MVAISNTTYLRLLAKDWGVYEYQVACEHETFISCKYLSISTKSLSSLVAPDIHLIALFNVICSSFASGSSSTFLFNAFLVSVQAILLSFFTDFEPWPHQCAFFRCPLKVSLGVCLPHEHLAPPMCFLQMPLEGLLGCLLTT
jgi:hypothetical protein